MAQRLYDGVKESEARVFPNLLRREILILLAAKAALLTLLYFLFFAPSHQTVVTPDRLRAHVMGQ
jgi:hypothetical protein